MAYARTQAKRLVVSLFVNPTQFGPGEDLDAYPRNPERDAEVARSQGADALFMPEPGAMYHPDHGTWVEVPDLSRGLCGLSRPEHFRGVCTVVLKLFIIDLSDAGSIGRIISFLVVGLLMLVIGFFAPLPPKSTDESDHVA